MDIQDFEQDADGIVRLASLRDFVVGEAKILVAVRIQLSDQKWGSETFEDRFLQVGMTTDQARLFAQDLSNAADRVDRGLGEA